MGRATLITADLTAPFFSIEEWIVPIPVSQLIDTYDDTFHLIFVLEGDFLLKIPDHPEMRLAKGDAHSLSFPTQRILRPAHPNRETLVHFLRLQFRWPPLRTFPYRKPTGSSEKRFAAALRQKLSGFQYFPHSLFGEYFPIARRILSEMGHQSVFSAWKISGLCQTLTAGLLASEESKDKVSSHLASQRDKGTIIEYALQYLEENCHEPLTLDAIAWQVRVSGEHLARLFKQETNHTVFTWLDHFRTEKVRNLLALTSWPLSQIAAACGYSSANLLIRHFRKNIGIPPITYRTKIQKEEVFSPSKVFPISDRVQKFRSRRQQRSKAVSKTTPEI